MANRGKLVLGEGVSFLKWKSSLQVKLAKRQVLGHVFHDTEEIEPIVMPQPPQPKKEDQTDSEYAEIQAKYKSERAAWKLGEIAARSIIIGRLSDSVCPHSYEKYLAKQLYDCVARVRQETATAPYAHALERFLATKFDSSADDYCDRFLANY